MAAVELDAEGYPLQLTVHDEFDYSTDSDEEARNMAEIMCSVIRLRVPTRVDVKKGSSYGQLDKLCTVTSLESQGGCVKPIVFLLHPVGIGSTRAMNVASAKMWLRALIDALPDIAFDASWLPYAEIAIDRERGICDAICVLDRCDAVVAVGGEFSRGMTAEWRHAEQIKLQCVDLTRPPMPTILTPETFTETRSPKFQPRSPTRFAASRRGELREEARRDRHPGLLPQQGARRRAHLRPARAQSAAPHAIRAWPRSAYAWARTRSTTRKSSRRWTAPRRWRPSCDGARLRRRRRCVGRLHVLRAPRRRARDGQALRAGRRQGVRLLQGNRPLRPRPIARDARDRLDAVVRARPRRAAGRARGRREAPRPRRRIRVATAPWDSHPTWDYDRRWWLKEHFSITPDRIHSGSDKFVLRGDFLVDNRAKHVAAWLEKNPGKVGVLWRTPHNRTEVLPAGARETSSWDQLHRWVSDRADGHRQQLDMEVVVR